MYTIFNDSFRNVKYIQVHPKIFESLIYRNKYNQYFNGVQSVFKPAKVYSCMDCIWIYKRTVVTMRVQRCVAYQIAIIISYLSRNLLAQLPMQLIMYTADPYKRVRRAFASKVATRLTFYNDLETFAGFLASSQINIAIEQKSNVVFQQ